MAKKRFTDIEIWDREWYMELTPKHKCLMKYIFDKCDASGCWKPNWKLASLHINDTVKESDLNMLPKDQYEVLPNGKIFIPDFINFQYGKISKKSPAHNPVFSAIEKNNLSDRVFNRVLDTLKEEDIDIEEEKEEEEKKVKPIIKKGFNTMPTVSDFNGLPEQYIRIACEMIFMTRQVRVTEKEIIPMWEIFKVQKLTGSDYYPNEGKVYSYFTDWVKTKDLKGVQSSKNKNSFV